MPEQSPYEMVRDFHRAFKHPVRNEPSTVPVTPEVRDFRIELIREEFEEYCEAVFGREVFVIVTPSPGGDATKKPRIVDAADAMADMVYVIAGAALVYGVDLDAVFEEVHASNMSKLGADGKAIYRDDGKIMKGPNYRKPDIAKVLGI